MDEQILGAAEAALQRAGVLRRGAVLLVALSGGPDSVVLLYAMRALAEKHGLAVHAAHVEHGLRGEASEKDARFCEQLCRKLAVPFTCDHAALEGGMDAPGAEARAREARYVLLLNRARECGADALLLAHHRDDQAETVLAHMLRGSGARGLGGMREATTRGGVKIVRPLLALSKANILNALADTDYRVDESNRQPCCQRNRLRAEVLPLLEKENPHAAEHIAQSASLLAMDEDCLEGLAEALLQKALVDTPPFYCLIKSPLLSAPDAVAVRALRVFAERGIEAVCRAPGAPGPEEHTLSAADSLRLLTLVRSPKGGSMNLPQGLRADATARYVHLTRMEDGAPLFPATASPPVTGLADRRIVRFGNVRFALSPFNPAKNPQPDGQRSVVLPDALLAEAVLRTARPGDRIHPFGAAGGKLLRRYYTDRKVDAPFRPAIPLVCAGGEALWAVGLGAAEATRERNGPATLLVARGAMPWQAEPNRR